MSDQRPSKELFLPYWHEVSEKKDSGIALSALEQFIFDQEPAGVEQEKQFREGLRAAIAECSVVEPKTAVDPAPLYKLCPFTGREFFMWIEHPELGRVPTYGGPYDSYTIPTPDDDGERTLRCERYDHDAGGWIEGGEPLHLHVIDSDEFARLHARAAEPPIVLPSEVPAVHRSGTEPLSRIIGDLRFCLSQVNPEHQVHSVLSTVVESLSAAQPQPRAHHFKIGDAAHWGGHKLTIDTYAYSVKTAHGNRFILEESEIEPDSVSTKGEAL